MPLRMEIDLAKTLKDGAEDQELKRGGGFRRTNSLQAMS